MPLRDHFRPPLSEKRSWEGFHGGWPMMIVAALNETLPDPYFAAPQVHLGFATDLLDIDEYEVRVYDTRRGRRLVAAVEIVSPANKDRPEHRRAFVAKCAALLQERVSVAIVDIVTIRPFDLYGELMDLFGQGDSRLINEAAPLHAAACRLARQGDGWFLRTWTHPLEIGRVLPTLPLWLAEDQAVPLELESSYEDTCHRLRIPLAI